MNFRIILFFFCNVFFSSWSLGQIPPANIYIENLDSEIYISEKRHLQFDQSTNVYQIATKTEQLTTASNVYHTSRMDTSAIYTYGFIPYGGNKSILYCELIRDSEKMSIYIYIYNAYHGECGSFIFKDFRFRKGTYLFEVQNDETLKRVKTKIMKNYPFTELEIEELNQYCDNSAYIKGKRLSFFKMSKKALTPEVLGEQKNKRCKTKAAKQLINLLD